MVGWRRFAFSPESPHTGGGAVAPSLLTQPTRLRRCAPCLTRHSSQTPRRDVGRSRSGRDFHQCYSSGYAHDERAENVIGRRLTYKRLTGKLKPDSEMDVVSVAGWDISFHASNCGDFRQFGNSF